MSSSNSLSPFELPRQFVEPALQACRMFNTGLDAAFYDVPTLVKDLRERGIEITSFFSDDAASAKVHLNLSALKNPEGSLIVVNAAAPPYLWRFPEVDAFLRSSEAQVRGVRTVSITGVGSSALGSAALAWNASKALGASVLAIVPGYGVADVILQALGGWYGFGLYDFLQTKASVQELLAAVAPKTAAIGRKLSSSAPDSPHLANGGPVFRTGSGSSDVLHLVMQRRTIKCLIGHSKGALVIANALRSLNSSQTRKLRIVTLGCPISEELQGASYHQFLGLFDALGQLNAWGHWPDEFVATDHSTNASFPLSMHAEQLIDS